MADLEERVNNVIRYCNSLLNAQVNPATGIDMCTVVRKQVAHEVLIILDSFGDNVTNPKAERELS